MPDRKRTLARSPLVRFVLLTLVVSAAVGAWLGVRALLAERHLGDARTALTQARTALLDQQLPAARAAIEAAGQDTERARSLTSDPVWRAVASVPVGGRSLRTAAGLARAADEIARQVLPPSLTAAELLAPDQLRGPDGSFDLVRVQQAGAPVELSSGRLAAVRGDLQDLPRDRLLEPIARGRGDVVAEADELAAALEAAARGLRLAPALLGEDRPRRFFVLVQQTSEARGTGGLPGGFVILETDRGRVRVAQSGSNADLRNGEIPVPPGVPADYVSLYAGNGAFSLWQNVNLSPDLPVVARVVAARWRAQGGAPVDGVVALDGAAVAAILRGGPPIALSDGRQVAADGIEEYLGIGQYAGFGRDDQRARKDELADVARVAAERLTAGGADDQVVRGVVQAVRSGHLRMASDDPALRDELADAGVDGALPAGDAPVAYPVVINAAGGKLDYFLDRSVVYAAGACRDGRRPSSIAVELRNTAPASGLPPYVTIRGVGGRTVDSTDNEVLLQVYGTRGARLSVATLDGAGVPVRDGGPGAYLTARTEAGLPMWQIQLTLPRERTRRLVLQLVEPTVPGQARVPEQPLARPLRQDVRVDPC